MPRSIIRNNKGVSEIVASLLIILIVSVAGAALYSYSLTTFSSSSSSFQSLTTLREERTQERLSIIAVWWDNSTGQDLMNITILNAGKIHFAIDAVYVNGTAALTFTDGRGTTVVLSDIVSVKFNSPIIIDNDQSYEIVAITERGSKDAISWKA